MSVVKCQDCGGLFSFLPRGVCADCLEQIETDYHTVRDYLRANPKSLVYQVAEATEVAESRIQSFISEGRIDLASGADSALSCEVCGTTITAGRHCDPCRARLVAGLSNTFDVHERLIQLTNGQRRAVAAGQIEVVEVVAREMETSAMRLSAVEDARQRAAAEVADAVGAAATRWASLREALNAVDRMALDPRVERLESLVRELELANAINGELIRREMELMDFSIRGLMSATQGPSVKRYTAVGRMADPQGASPVLLNTTA